LQKLRRHETALGDYTLGRLNEGGSALMQRAGAAMAPAARHEPCIGLHQAEALERKTEEIRRDLWEARLMALAVRLRAEHQRHLA